jgi:hypothetical protein
MPPARKSRSVAIVAARRLPIRRSASSQATRAREPARSPLETMKTGMTCRPATPAAIAPWKSANQWYVRGTPAKYGTWGGKLPSRMLWPMATWTRKSLQFQPPETQPPEISCQALAARMLPTPIVAKAARRKGARSRRTAAKARRGSRAGGGARPGSGAAARTRLALARRAAVAKATGRLKPPAARPRTLPRWAAKNVEVTIPTPSRPAGPIRGTTRATRSQPGTTNRNGQATATATGGAYQANANTTMPSIATPGIRPAGMPAELSTGVTSHR